MTRDQEQILRDLGRHTRNKFLRVINDHVDLCMAAELPYKDVSANLMSFFVSLAATFAAGHFNISASEFARTMLMEFKQAEARAKVEEDD